MAYKMSDVGGWGTGALGDISNPSGQINSYANVTAISTNTVTIGTPSAGIYETFVVGKEILLHVSAVLSGTDATKLGKYLVATITGVSGSVLTLSKDVAANLVANADLSTLVVQAITVAQFGTLTLSSGSITPPVYSTTNKYGGVIALKCKTELVFSGGSISLVDKGIPTASSAMRPLTAQETEMIGTGKHTTGWENHITARQALMNCGNGVAMIWAKKTTVSSTNSRIGGAAAGVAYYPYASGDNSPAEVLGGSTILLASETIVGFSAGLISKGNGTGTGYGRCYIATETLLPNDEGLYAQDCLSNPNRLRDMGITSFGDGRTGDITLTDTQAQVNSSARITAMGASRNVFTVGPIISGAYNALAAGETVCIHATASVAGATASLGKFIIAKVLGISGSIVTVDKALPTTFVYSDYSWQMIVVPQFNNLTLSGTQVTLYSGSAWIPGSAYPGGVVVIMVKGTLTINANMGINWGILDSDLTHQTARPYMATQCSGQQKDSLPINYYGYHGNIIIAKHVIDNRVLSASYTGYSTVNGSGYCGGYEYPYYLGGYSGGGGINRSGGPWAGGEANDGGNMGLGGLYNRNSISPCYSTSCFMVADTLTNFKTRHFLWDQNNYNRFSNGPGYGSNSNIDSGANVTGAGASTRFIYVNNLINPDYTGAVV